MELQNTTLDDVSAVIGFSATLRLAAWFGDGGNLYVPETVEDGQLLVRLIGMSAAKKLSEEWGREHLSLPRLRAYEDDVRKQQVGRMFEKGFGSKEIGRLTRMGERRVQQICRELEVAGLIGIVAPKIGGKNAGENAPQKSGGKPCGKIGGKNAPEKDPLELPMAFFAKGAQ